jgi:hypothetical protein
VSFTEQQLRLLIYCTDQERLARHAGKVPGPQGWEAPLIEALAAELAVSASGQQNGGGEGQLSHENWIGSEQAAAILGWHVRTVRRRYADLDGRKVSGALVFRESTVREYSEALTDE